MKLIDDIYYLDSYISLYLKDDEELFSFIYEESDNFFINKTIKRPIKKIGDIEVNDNFYDLETAYGYGGYYTNSDDIDFLKEAFKAYEEKCKKIELLLNLFVFIRLMIFLENIGIY
jgi:hypothetical protein